KEISQRFTDSTDEAKTITLCPCHGLGEKIIIAAQQHY
ncbi:unnamed protein product, partial [marine sediment metagenome]